MRKFKVTGFMPGMDNEVSTTVEASSEREAALKAREDGYSAVAKVVELELPSPPAPPAPPPRPPMRKPSPASSAAAYLTSLSVFGAILAVAAVPVCVYSIFADTTYGDTHNIGLISDRETAAILGGAFFVAGGLMHVLGYAGAAILTHLRPK